MICTALTSEITTNRTSNATTTSSTVLSTTELRLLVAPQRRRALRKICSVLPDDQGGGPRDVQDRHVPAGLDHLVTVARPRGPYIPADLDSAPVPVHALEDDRRGPDERLVVHDRLVDPLRQPAPQCGTRREQQQHRGHREDHRPGDGAGTEQRRSA